LESGESFYQTGIYADTFRGDGKEPKVEYLVAADLEKINGLSVIDIGAGFGGFLDSLSGRASRCVAIEPSHVQAQGLQGRFETYSFARDLPLDRAGLDIATSFNVIEHVEDPRQFLLDIGRCLKKDGSLFLVTPNFNDILNQLIPGDFSRYFYRTAHLFYFCEPSIRNLLENAGFAEIEIGCHHKYGMDNLIHWLSQRSAQSDYQIPWDFSSLTDSYRSLIESKGLGSHLVIRCKKK
jgi:SAM-dependent methyltransferase